MKFNNQGFWGICYDEKTDTYYISNGNGFLLDKSDTIKIAKGLLRFCHNISQDEINEFNIKNQEDIYNYYGKSNFKKVIKYKPKYLYLLECAGKYKIGISDNIERRINQLDKRPFKLNLIARTNILREDAYAYEQYLHNQLKDNNIGGEWFDLDQSLVDKIINYYNRLDKVMEGK